MNLLKIHVLITILFISDLAIAQEFNCEVSINDTQLEGNDFDYVSGDLSTAIEEYINEFRWTEHEFQEQEQINCQMNIILADADANYTFTAEAIIQSRRPIYNTLSETTTIIISDQSWRFSYQEGTNLVHDDLQFDALSGFIDYYCYLLLGYDFDTFSALGGTPYFQAAQNVVDLAQSSDAVGWDRNLNNRRNRFMLVEDLLNTNFNPVREAYYTFHRQILDNFINNPTKARQDLLTTLSSILASKRRSSSTYVFDLFFDTKSKEIASILEDADSRLRLEAYTILSELDTSHLSDYEALQN